jgi:IclR family transcriptional regulator, pca regulon regulatory protein
MPRVRRSEAEQQAAEAHGPDYLESLARGLRVIQAFDRDRRELTLSEAAKLVDLPRASVRRTLHTLVQLGFVETDDRLFRLTPRILTLAGAYLISNPIVDVLQPAVERLSEQVGEACSAAVLDGGDVVMIAHASPRRFISVSAQIGLRLPVVSSSLGRALLAAKDDNELERILGRLQPVKLTGLTVVNKTELRKAILRTRSDGYSLVDQEVEVGFRSISVPLRRLDGRVIAALNIGVHSERISLDIMRDEFLPKLRQTADTLQRQLL